MNTPSPSLYLRTDGSVLMARGTEAIELRLTTAQLLHLGMECLHVAVSQNPSCLPIAANIMSAAEVPAHLFGEADQALVDWMNARGQSDLIPGGAPCPLN